MPVAFVEERFNTEIRYGMVGGPEYSTTIVETSSGVEEVQINWTGSLGAWVTAQDLYNRTEIDALIAFFNARQGRAIGFRFKAWEDYQVTLAQGIILSKPWGLQLYKRYQTPLGGYIDKIIQKPVPGTVVLAAGGSVNYNTGVVTGGTAATQWSGEFDRPVRFTVDKFECEFAALREVDGERLFQVTGLGLREIRIAGGTDGTVAVPLATPVIAAAPRGPAPIPAAPPPVGSPAPAPSGGTIAVANWDGYLLQTGNPTDAYWSEDGVWGPGSLTRGTYTGITGSQYEQYTGVKATVGTLGEVGWRMKWMWPTGTTEVKAYPSMIKGNKPGYYNTWVTPGGMTVRLPDGTDSTVYPSGPTPGSFFPLQLPIAPLYTQWNYTHIETPTGRGHLSYDIWLQDSAPQINGFSCPPISHEIMIPINYWGNYGAYGYRNPGWYYGDYTIDGHLFHVYYTFPFFGGWHFIVFEPDNATALGASGSLNLHNFINFAVDHGWASASNYCVSVELGVEPVDGTGDLIVDNYRVHQ